MRLALTLLAMVGIVHYGYPLLDDSASQEWLFYIARGFEGAALFAIVGYQLKEGPYAKLALFACALGFMEEAQTALCGAIMWGTEAPTPEGLCSAQFGWLPYAAIGAACLTYFITRKDTNDEG